MNDRLELTLRRTIPAPRKEVFEAWLDPAALSDFIRPAAGVTVSKAETDPRVGGAFLIVMRAGEQDLPHHGEYRTIDRYEKLVFTWSSHRAPPDSLVTLRFVEKGPRETELTLHHAGLPDEESRADHEGGWTGILDTLGTFLG